MNNIIPVYDINDLYQTIKDYPQIVKTKKENENSNNKRFNRNFEKIINELF